VNELTRFRGPVNESKRVFRQPWELEQAERRLSRLMIILDFDAIFLEITQQYLFSVVGVKGVFAFANRPIACLNRPLLHREGRTPALCFLGSQFRVTSPLEVVTGNRICSETLRHQEAALGQRAVNFSRLPLPSMQRLPS
jgi:hypothetical protein